MTHLYIEQGSNVEVVTPQVLLKLYDIASSNSIETCVLKGNLLSQHCYDYVYDYLTGKVNAGEYRFPDLFLNITDGVYISFVDSVIADYWINSSYSDGTGIAITTAQNVTAFPKRLTADNSAIGNEDLYNLGQYAFYKDKTVTSFNELGKFTNITNIPTSMFRESTLKYIDLSNITTIEAAAFAGADLTGVVNIPKLTTWNGRSNTTTKNMDYLYFHGNTHMTEIHLGTNIPYELKFTSISSYTFEDCSGLTDITGLSHVESIGYNAFRRCYSLENLQDLNDTTTLSIGNDCFHDCTNLKCINLTNVTWLGQSVFENCSSLVALDTNDPDHINDNTEYTINVSGIGYRTFLNASLSGKTLKFPNVTTITSYAFCNCELTGDLSLPKLTTIGEFAFAYSKITSVTDLGQIKSLPNNVFNFCDQLTYVVVPGTVTSLYLKSFIGTRVLKLIVKEGVSNIYFENFSTFGTTAYVEFPSTVNSFVGFLAYNSFSSSEENSVIFVIKATNPPSTGGFPLYNNKVSKIYVPDDSVSAYLTSSGVWTYSALKNKIAPISQLLTDNPTYWAVYQSGLSNS